MKNIKFVLIMLAIIVSNGCFKDLDTRPIDPLETTSDVVYDDPATYKRVLAKLYAGLALSGQQGPAGQADIQGIDEGFGQYLRGFWYHQVMTTDESVIGWADQTIHNFHGQNWTSQDGFTYAFYSRVFYQIMQCNEFIRETTDSKLDERGVFGTLREEIKRYRAEARFLRALSYWHGLDIFRNVPFVTENDIVGAFFPKQTNANDLFAYLESELKAIEPDLAAPRSNEYARADRAAAWALLAKLYLNAQVYIGQNRYTDCLQVCEQIINSGFVLDPVYQHLFLADNHRCTEVIFPIAFDGNSTPSFGGTTFIINAAIGGSMNASALGMAGGWGGTRATRQLLEKFPQDLTGILLDYNTGQTASYPKAYIPGSFQGFMGGESMNSISSKGSNQIFEGYRYFPANNTEFVILRRPSETLNGKLGSNNQDGTLQTNGANIVAGQSGLYYIKADLRSGSLGYELDRRTASISGSATGGAEINFTWNDQLGLGRIEASGEMSQGSFLITIRGSNSTIVLGDNGADGTLEVNGAPIQIAQSGGHKITLDLKQEDYNYKLELTSFDRRGFFYLDGQTIDIDDLTVFTQGVGVQKFKNITRDGVAGSNATHPDTDFPMFRLADIYLMAAEAIVRNSGDISRAVEYVNIVRQRAYTGTAGNITASELTLDFLIDERARELYWECHRRTDLIRFGKFSATDYLWQWKGGVRDGRSTEPFRDIFPIPSIDIGLNPNLQQNPGY